MFLLPYTELWFWLVCVLILAVVYRYLYNICFCLGRNKCIKGVLLVGKNVILSSLYDFHVKQNSGSRMFSLKGRWKGEEQRWNDIISYLHLLYSAVVGWPTGKEISTFKFLRNFLSQLLVPSAGGNFRKPCRTGSNLAITVIWFWGLLTVYVMRQCSSIVISKTSKKNIETSFYHNLRWIFM